MNGCNSRGLKKQKMNWYKLSMIAAVLIGPLTSAGQSKQPTPQTLPTPPTPVQIVALDECDPTTFNADPNAKENPGLGPDFCKNITLGAFTTLQKLFDEAGKGTPDPDWDFEPDTLRIVQGTPIVVANEGGEPHTFTEVKQFGGGFIDGLNDGQPTVSECSEGFKNVAVARTRILQGGQFLVGNLQQGNHYFQCCIHPWMRVKVEVQDREKREK
jgi:plastocyanin